MLHVNSNDRDVGSSERSPLSYIDRAAMKPQERVTRRNINTLVTVTNRFFEESVYINAIVEVRNRNKLEPISVY